MSDLVPTYSEERLVELLGALAACDGSPRLAAKRLEEEGIEVKATTLATLRDRHAGMYQAIAVERSRAQEEAIAQEFRELARLGQRATRTFLEDINAKLESPEGLDYETKRHLPQLLQAMAKVQQVSVDKLLSITGRPQDGGTGDPLKGAMELVKLGVLKPVERPTADIDGTAEETTP